MPTKATLPARIGFGKMLTRAAAVLVAALLLVLLGRPVLADEGATDGHDHAADESHTGHGEAAIAPEGHPAREPTAAERAAADVLVTAVRLGTGRFADADVALAEGYVQGTPYAFYGLRAAHFHNEAYSQDGKFLDPERPEDLMYIKTDDGELELIGVMFIAPPGEGPRVGGPLTAWHTHDDLCGGEEGVIAKYPDGTCPAGTYPIEFEMLHVWLIDVPGGPFADNPLGEIDGPLVGAGDEHNSLVAGVSLIDGEAMLRAIGELLRLTPEEIGRRYEAGESLAEMAAAQGVPREELIQLMMDWLIAGFDAAVARGDMSPAQRDLTVRHLRVHVERMVEIHAGEPWLEEAAPAA